VQDYMGDEDGVDQVKMEDDSLVVLGRCRTHIYIEEVVSRRSKSIQEAWPSDGQKKNWTITVSG
jgi:hypothetical protein